MGGAAEEVTFSVGGRALRGNLYLPDGTPTKYLLFVHGLGSNRSGYAERASAASRCIRAAALTFDLGGHGDSDGRFEDLTPAGHLMEVAEAYDFLLRASPSSTETQTMVGVCGASYGGYLSALLPGVREVWRMLLRAPALYPDALFNVPLGQTRRSEATKSSMLASSASRFKGRVLVVESEDDTVIPHDVILQYLAEFPRSRHSIIEGAPHALEQGEHKKRFLKLILNWFS